MCLHFCLVNKTNSSGTKINFRSFLSPELKLLCVFLPFLNNVVVDIVRIL